jgi:hypothetical protein
LSLNSNQSTLTLSPRTSDGRLTLNGDSDAMETLRPLLDGAVGSLVAELRLPYSAKLLHMTLKEASPTS